MRLDHPARIDCVATPFSVGGYRRATVIVVASEDQQ